MVGALLSPPTQPGVLRNVLFFNNVGCLNMCGHGSMGVIAALAYLGEIAEGRHLLATPVGTVACELTGKNRVSVENVTSYRHRAGVRLHVPEYGDVTGDVAWGGNWFFLTEDRPCEIALVNEKLLTAYATAVRRALVQQGITGVGGAEIDHVELFGPAQTPGNHSRNFVLCPGGAYDRSPCGTGTSAKLACLMAEGQVAAGEVYRQEGILGGCFEAVGKFHPDGISPKITGEAFVNAETRIVFDPQDPFRYGILR